MWLGSHSARSAGIVVIPSTTASYYVVLRRCSIFPTLPALQAKDRRKSPCTLKMFALKLANLTKIILKTLCSAGLKLTMHEASWYHVHSFYLLNCLLIKLLCTIACSYYF